MKLSPWLMSVSEESFKKKNSYLGERNSVIYTSIDMTPLFTPLLTTRFQFVLFFMPPYITIIIVIRANYCHCGFFAFSKQIFLLLHYIHTHIHP